MKWYKDWKFYALFACSVTIMVFLFFESPWSAVLGAGMYCVSGAIMYLDKTEWGPEQDVTIDVS